MELQWTKISLRGNPNYHNKKQSKHNMHPRVQTSKQPKAQYLKIRYLQKR